MDKLGKKIVTNPRVSSIIKEYTELDMHTSKISMVPCPDCEEKRNDIVQEIQKRNAHIEKLRNTMVEAIHILCSEETSPVIAIDLSKEGAISKAKRLLINKLGEEK